MLGIDDIDVPVRSRISRGLKNLLLYGLDLTSFFACAYAYRHASIFAKSLALNCGHPISPPIVSNVDN